MTEVGTIFSINSSPGGVPKLPVGEVFITAKGLSGDIQANRKYHGGPDRAVSIFSLERIRSLQEEGHPIGTGTTGENLTIAGLDWDLVTPGSLLESGQLLLEVTSYTPPCRKISESFIGGKFGRMSQRTHPGWSRVYARVLNEGLVRAGDTVTLTPPGTDAKGWLESLFA